MRALLGALGLVLALASSARAQETVISSARVDAWDRADLSWVTPPAGAPIRVVVRGTLTCALDGSEIDALEVVTPTRTLADVSPLVFPEGTQLVERRGDHAYLFEVPPGRGTSIALNVAAIAGRHLVTASEARSAITGAIMVEVLGAPAAPVASTPALAVVEPASTQPLALAGAAVGLPMLAFGLFLATRRRRAPEAELIARATRAQRAIVREARTLGPAFDGALVSAETLFASAIRQRAHLAELDRALARTGWVSSAGAAAGLDVLRARRAEGVARLDAIVARLEETVVRMAACVADRTAIADLARDLERLRGELEVGESVEQELASIAR